MLPKFLSDDVRGDSDELLERYSGRRGSIATQTALLLPVLLGFTALAVDSAYLFVEQTHQQAAVDGASLAALSGYVEDEDVLRSRAGEAMGWNQSVMGTASTFETKSTAQVETGTWDAKANAFVPT